MQYHSITQKCNLQKAANSLICKLQQKNEKSALESFFSGFTLYFVSWNQIGTFDLIDGMNLGISCCGCFVSDPHIMRLPSNCLAPTLIRNYIGLHKCSPHSFLWEQLMHSWTLEELFVHKSDTLHPNCPQLRQIRDWFLSKLISDSH